MAVSLQLFTWDLDVIGVTQRPEVEPFIFRCAEKDQRKEVERVLLSVLAAEPPLTGSYKSIDEHVESVCDVAFTKDHVDCIVVLHGQRIIGATALDASPDARDHLLTGPAITREYRNRGLGSALLFASLDHLRQRGLRSARAVADSRSRAARSVFPKFGSVVSELGEAAAA